jgi:hypothetical protein
MKITREHFKNIVREVLAEEAEYQQFFKKALEKAGKSITQMSDDEKKSFFNKIDSAWNGKGEKNEDLVGKQHKLDVDKDGDIGADDLADLRAGKKVEEGSSKEKEIYTQIEKLRVLSNAGKITGDQFLDKFYPLWKQLKGTQK